MLAKPISPKRKTVRRTHRSLSLGDVPDYGSSSLSSRASSHCSRSDSSLSVDARRVGISPSLSLKSEFCVAVTAKVSDNLGKSSKFLLYPTYHISVEHYSTGALWVVERTLSEVLQFEQHLLQLLDKGHNCNGCCPSIFFVLDAFARHVGKGRRLLFSRWSGALLQSTAREVQSVLQSLFDQMSTRTFLLCRSVPDRLVGVIQAFFSIDSDQDKAIFDVALTGRRHSWAEDTDSSSGSSSNFDTNDVSLCIICNVAASSNVTTLPCGHKFHDECILDYMESNGLCCPFCHASLE